MATIKVTAWEKERLDKVLLAEFDRREEKHTRSELKGWIENGAVTVNGKAVSKAGYPLVPGDTVVVQIPEETGTTLHPYDFELTVLFEDEHIVVIDKPAGISMHPGAGEKRKTIANALHKHLRSFAEGEKTVRPGIVHRLDKDTTGVVVVAKTRESLFKLTTQFASRSATRRYKALVFTTPRASCEVGRAESGTIDLPLGRHPKSRVKMAVVDKGRRAVTHWTVLEAMKYGRLLDLRLETGRTHQIRVHLSHLGSPIVGDTTYGDFSAMPQNLKNASETLGRQALHAYKLQFVHPFTDKELSFETEMPPDMKEVVRAFKEYSA